MREQVIVYIEDRLYGERFVHYLEQNRSQSEFFYYSDYELYEKAIKTMKADILIVDETFVDLQIIKDNVRRVVRLTSSKEYQGSSVEETNQIKTVYQFQSMKQVMSEIWGDEIQELSLISQRESKDAFNLYTILLLDSELLQDGVNIFVNNHKASKKTLCISLLQFDLLCDSKRKREEAIYQGLSDVIYHLSNHTLTREVIESLVVSYKGIDYLPPVNHCLDLYDLTREGAEELLEILICMGYERIFVIVSTMTESSVEFIRCSKHTFYLCLSKENAEYRDYVLGQLNDMLQVKNQSSLESIQAVTQKELMDKLQHRVTELLEECL